MVDSVVTVKHRDAVAVIRIDDGKVNALSLTIIAELQQALTEQQELATAVVITGRAGCLSAGLERGAMLGEDRAARSASLRTVTGLYETIMDLHIPTVVACNGHALAAGALLLLAADHRIGARVPCKIGLNETQIGLQLFPLGVALARARLLTTQFVRSTLGGAVYDAGGAAEVGYLDYLVEGNDLVDAAVRQATQLGNLDRRAYLATRRLVLAPVIAEVAAQASRPVV